MIVALLSIVGGVVLIMVGVVMAFFSFGEFKGWYAVCGIFGGICIFLLGIFMELYMGWWGVLRAIIDYAKA